MARLFTAIELTPAVRTLVAEQQAFLVRTVSRPSDRSLRPVGVAQLHLTLVFIGEVSDERVSGITQAMSDALPVPSFELDFGGCGVFPPRGPARVLWLGVTRGARELNAAFEAVASRLEAAGVPRESRPFAAHLTIGRWRDRGVSSARPALPAIGHVATERVSSVTLFRSRLLVGGPEHTAL
ncbi:MAG TPA: RNA 2',3'-cyclic phosphodiesterase, partial [Gemmatimonadaceae bacterium]